VGRTHTLIRAAEAPPRTRRLEPVLRCADVLVAALALLAVLPLMGALALAVRRSSHGPVLHREPGFDRKGRPVELLTFRTAVDGAGTTTHERLRSVVGHGETAALTGVGAFLRRTRLDRLPRLLNVVAGQSSFF
jgi:lipopolysaccharide/colanic/teichoic acid biosynthesis glycosyltransferase